MIPIRINNLSLARIYLLLITVTVRSQDQNFSRNLFDRCAFQQRRMLECLQGLMQNDDHIEKSLARKALKREPALQVLFLERWSDVMQAYEKCRILDDKFSNCAPSIDNSTWLSVNQSQIFKPGYLIDKIQCDRQMRQENDTWMFEIQTIVGKKASCFDEAENFSRSENERPEACRVTDAVQSCFQNETLRLQALWSQNESPAARRLQRLFEAVNRRRSTRWNCFECLYVAKPKCRENTAQRNCIYMAQKNMEKTYNDLMRQCMTSKGHDTVMEYQPEIEIFLQGRDATTESGNLCYWLNDAFHLY
uniref:Uncharacterized protein n=1 Tax=Romanomermis culicivorax TaxID=13658 RepID=A0A915KDY2_ROMCU